MSRTYAYNGDGLLQSRTQTPLPATSVLWDPATSPSRLVQIGTDKIVYGLGPLYVVSALGTTTFARDGQKSVRAEVSSLGVVTASFRYRAYGSISQFFGATTPSWLGYAGQLVDPSGLYYMRARWYDPAVGRLLVHDQVNGDPSLPLTLNAYAYSGANPIRYSDPSGLCFIICLEDLKLSLGFSTSGTSEAGAGPLGSAAATLTYMTPLKALIDGQVVDLPATTLTSAGEFTTSFGETESLPPAQDSGSVGAYAGGGGSVWIANTANPSQDLLGRFHSEKYDVGVIAGFSAEFAWADNGTWVFNFSPPGAGGGVGIAATHMDTYTIHGH